MTSRSLILGIDPGLATGVALLDYADLNNLEVKWSDEKSVEEFYDFLELFLSNHKDDVSVVIEDYIITDRTSKLSQQPWSLMLIGVTSYLCYKYDVPMKKQKPKDKVFADNNKLKKIGLWHRGGEGHANDAFRHCLVWLIDRHPQVAKSLI